MGGPFAQPSPLARISPFGVLPYDHEVAFRARCPRRAQERAEVHVEVELEAQPQEEAPFEQAGRDLRRSDRRPHSAEHDRVVSPQFVEDRVGQDLAGSQVMGGAELVAGGLEPHAGGLHDLERLCDHLGADPVAADDRDAMLTGTPACLSGHWFPDHLSLLSRSRPPLASHPSLPTIRTLEAKIKNRPPSGRSKARAEKSTP